MTLCVFACFVFCEFLGLPLSPGAEETALPARTVSLTQPALPLSSALAEIEKQIGMKKGSLVDRRNDGDPELKLAIRNVPFWKAIDIIADEVGAAVYISAREGRISLVKRLAQNRLPISYSGPFRVAIKRITLSRDLETNTDHATASFEVAWEPQIQPFLLETRPQNLLVENDKNVNMPVNPEGTSLAPVDGRIALLFDVVLPAPKRSVQEYGLIEGSLSAVGPSKLLHFNFGPLDQLHKAAPGASVRQQKMDGITCRITKVTLAGDRWTIQVTQDTPPGHQLESFQSWVVNNEMTLESRDGSRRFTSSSYVLESATTRQAVLSYHFVDSDRASRGKPADCNLLYTTPARVIVTAIPFRFKNIPLP